MKGVGVLDGHVVADRNEDNCTELTKLSPTDQASDYEQNHKPNGNAYYMNPFERTDFRSPSPNNCSVDFEHMKLMTIDNDASPVTVLCRNETSDGTSDDGSGAPTGQEERETWGKKIDFLLSVVGFAVDLANVWRFPYLCYKNGGGAFLIPYFIMLVFGAVPLFYMELILGQFHKEGAISLWKIAPIFKGIGVAECIISFYVAFYYNVIIAWAIYYLAGSFNKELPWTKCNHQWNSPYCLEQSLPTVPSDHNNSQQTLHNITTTAATTIAAATSTTTDSNNLGNFTNHSTLMNSTPYFTPAMEYFERGMLHLQDSDGLEYLGLPRWELLLCLLFVFFILYFSLWKGVKSSGKVVWVTATLPYVVLACLLVRGVLLPGAKEGIKYFITPRIDRLGDVHVWIDAAVQIFYSTGAGFGAHLAYASYNKFDNNCYADCLGTVAVNCFTSLFSGFVIFSYLGNMALVRDVPIENVAAEGPGLVFVVYPEAISMLPGSIVWSIIFFIMLLALGLDSAMGGLEATITGISDEFRPFFKQYKYGREILTAIVVAAAFIFALPNITPGGVYLVTLWDTFAAGSSLLAAVLMQALGVAWVYGLGPFCKDAEKMLGFKPGIYWRICWKFVSPLFLLVIVISSIVSYQPLVYYSTQGVYEYPIWANTLGWCIAGSTIIMVPLIAIIQFIKTPGSLATRLAINISPEWEHRGIREGREVKRFKLRHWITI